jgi:hypothetical protein
MVVSEPRRYAGQTWAPDVFYNEANKNMWPGTALQIIGRDLAEDARTHNITGPVELWAHEAGHKGFFAGDTAGLAEKGWTRVATL